VEPHQGAPVRTQGPKWADYVRSRIIPGTVCCRNLHCDGPQYPFHQALQNNSLQNLIAFSLIVFRWRRCLGYDSTHRGRQRQR
jgi:hypothetical protein